MKLRTLDFLTDIQEVNGVALSAKVQCSCGATKFHFLHTGKQTKGIFSPYIIRHKRQLLLKAVCPICKNAIILYDSTQDGASSNKKGAACECKPFETNTLSSPFAIAIKYNYFPDNLKMNGVYSNQFENCFIYILDDNGKEGKALIEE